jgi:hypothetical protein
MRARLFSGLTVRNAGGGWSRFALMAGLVGSLVGCATPVQVQSDFDVSADFSRYQTFNFISDNPLLVATVEPVSPLLQGRLVDATRRGLTSKGYRYVADREQADFVVSFTLGQRDKIRVDSYPSNYGAPGAWRWGASYHTEVNVRTYTQGTLAIDIFEVKRRSPVWHGWGVKTISSQDRQNPTPLINEVVTSILAEFPPS